MNKELISLHLKIYGRVQGVFFRMHTRDMALKLGLSGTVRNCIDRSVEVSVEGNEAAINEFVKWCHIGPSAAKVDKVDIHEMPLKNFESFVILRD